MPLWYIALMFFFLIIFLLGLQVVLVQGSLSWPLGITVITHAPSSRNLSLEQLCFKWTMVPPNSSRNLTGISFKCLHLIVLWECIFWMFPRYCVTQGKIKHNIKYANIESSVGTRYYTTKFMFSFFLALLGQSCRY